MQSNNSLTLQNHATELFWRIGEEKRGRIIHAAVREFAACGFQNANVNRIAEAADISVGSLYKYFPTKDDLFLCIVEASSQRLSVEIESILRSDCAFLTKVESLVRLALRYSREDPELIKLYSVFTSEGNSELAVTLSRQLESISANAYRTLIAEAQEKGEIRRDIDSGVLAVMMDNQLMMTQFSYACEYYKERYQLYMGADHAQDDGFVIEHMMKVMRSIFLGGE
ncbi:MAG: TetR/AcrR family transcriptional regulator [Eubacteriales bacterium]|nr:TetR/AcrR family transcriptional regulator [Eubacteriales bacterium]